MILMLAPAGGLLWGQSVGNGRIELASGALLALELFVLVRIGRKYRAAHPEQAARIAQVQEAAMVRAKAHQRMKLRELGFFVLALVLFFAMPLFLRALFAQAPGLQPLFSHLSLKEQRLAMMLAALALVSAGRLFWYWNTRRPTG